MKTPPWPAFLNCVAVAVLLAACGGGSESEEEVQGSLVSVYRHSGAVQCVSAGESLNAMAHRLTDVGIPVAASSCGHDGRIVAALCGASSGQIGIFDVPQAHARAASDAGFTPLHTLPRAQRTVCTHDAVMN